MQVIVSINLGDNFGSDEEREDYEELETYEDVDVSENEEKTDGEFAAADPFAPEGQEYYGEYDQDPAYTGEYAYQDPVYNDQPYYNDQPVYDEQPYYEEQSAESAYQEPLFPEQPVETAYQEPAYPAQTAKSEQPAVTERVYNEPTYTGRAVAAHNYNEPAHAEQPVYDYSYYNYNDTSVHENNRTETNNYEIHNHYDVTYQMPTTEADPAAKAEAVAAAVAPAPAPEPEPEPVKEVKEIPSLAEFSVVGGAPFIPKTREEAERYLSVLLLIVDAAMADPDTKDADLEEIAMLIETARTESFREPADQEILAQCLRKLATRWSK